MTDRRALAEHLKFFQELGVSGVSRDASWRVRADDAVPSEGAEAGDANTGMANGGGAVDQAARLIAIREDLGPCTRCKLHTLGRKQIVFGVVTTGSESDLQTCTGIARSMVGRWGMSERIGPVSVFQPDADPRMSGVAEETLDAVDQEVRRLVEDAYKRAVQLLSENRQRLDGIVTQLLERETLDEVEVYAAAGIGRAPVETSAASV